MMKVGIMQPYFWPYLGYFQLIGAVDKFVIYDDIQYTKKGWINRNRYLCNGEAKYFSIALEKDSDFLDVCQRRVAKSFDKKKIENQIYMAYKKAPYFEIVYPIFYDCVEQEEENLFKYILYSVKRLVAYLGINTELIISSDLHIAKDLKGKDKVIKICQQLDATQYINPIGGVALYDKAEFEDKGLTLSFLQMEDSLCYRQFQNEFISSLSILDVLMFNPVNEVKKMLKSYKLV